MTISFDEWNLWHHSNTQDRAILDGAAGWPTAPRLLEDIYNFEDVLQVSRSLNTVIRKVNVVKIACIAQLVNVIAPIMTEPGGAAWRQTIYCPYHFASIFGTGKTLNLAVTCPGYDADVADKVPYLAIAGTHDATDGTVTFLAVIRHPTEVLPPEIALHSFGDLTVTDHQVMTHPDLNAVNSLPGQTTITPAQGRGATLTDNALTLPSHS